MIAIKPAPQERVQEICAREGFPWEGTMFACQADRDNWILFQLGKEGCTLWEAACEPVLLDALIRAALNVADLRGVDRYAFGGRMEAHWGGKLQSLGYPAGEGSIAALFQKSCGPR